MRRGYISSSYPDVIFDPQEEKKLAEARRAAYRDEKRKRRPDYHPKEFLIPAGKLLKEFQVGALGRLPLILSEQYEAGREAARRELEESERR